MWNPSVNVDPLALLTGNVTQIAYLIKQGYFGFETKNSTLATSEQMNHASPPPSLSFPSVCPNTAHYEAIFYTTSSISSELVYTRLPDCISPFQNCCLITFFQAV